MFNLSFVGILWDYIGSDDHFPIVRKIAIKILSQPCSSSACERNWSAWEAAQTKKRNRLTPEMLEDLVYVRMNSLIMSKFKEREEEDLKPIDLSKINILVEEDVVEERDDQDDDVGDSQNMAWMTNSYEETFDEQAFFTNVN